MANTPLALAAKVIPKIMRVIPVFVIIVTNIRQFNKIAISRSVVQPIIPSPVVPIHASLLFRLSVISPVLLRKRKCIVSDLLSLLVITKDTSLDFLLYHPYTDRASNRVCSDTPVRGSVTVYRSLLQTLTSSPDSYALSHTPFNFSEFLKSPGCCRNLFCF